jgi:uncharacterized protein (TIGR03086 family)
MSTVSPPRPVAVLDSAVVWTHDRLQRARSSPLDLPTPCAEWDLGRLLQHMEDSLAALGEAAQSGHVELRDPGASHDTGRTIDRLLQRACRTRAAWQQRVTSAPIGVSDLPLGRDTVVLVGALEVAVHGWDVARATGQPAGLPEDLAVRLYAVARAVVTPGERGRRFAPPLAVPDSAPASTRLLAHLGREASWCPPPGAG